MVHHQRSGQSATAVTSLRRPKGGAFALVPLFRHQALIAVYSAHLDTPPESSSSVLGGSPDRSGNIQGRGEKAVPFSQDRVPVSISGLSPEATPHPSDGGGSSWSRTFSISSNFGRLGRSDSGSRLRLQMSNAKADCPSGACCEFDGTFVFFWEIEIKTRVSRNLLI
jgi:hypothetical protein